MYKKTGKPSRAVAVVIILLFNAHKEAIIQKRSTSKKHNADLLDKSIGGHIRFGDSSHYTVQAETLEELSVPALVLSNDEDFKKSYKLLKQYLDRSALVQFVDSRVVPMKKEIQGETIEIANKYYFYVGIYTGSIKPADREAAGVMYYSLDALEKQMEKYPDQFTYDLQFFLEKYRKNIDAFLKCLD